MPLVPVALWGAWYVTLGSTRGTTDNLVHTPGYVVDEAGATMAALTGSSQTVGVVLAAALTVGLVVAVVRAWPIDGRFAACIAMVFGLWFLLAYGRDLRVPTTEGRYTYLGAVVVFLLGAEVLATWKPRRLPAPVKAATAAVLVAVLGVSVWVNIEHLHDGADEMRFAAMQYRVGWSALALAGPGIVRSAQVSYLPESHLLTAGSVLDAVHDLDYPLLDRDELLALGADWRIGADYQLAYTSGLQDRDPHGRPVGGALPIAAGGGTVTSTPGACATVEPTDGTARLLLHGDGISTRVEPGDAPVEVRVRVVADGFTDFPSETLQSRRARLVQLHPIDLGPWDVELRSRGKFRVCPVT